MDRRSYVRAFGTAKGKGVLADLERTFEQRQSSRVENEMAAIPHPYRAYVEMGQRMVVEYIRQAVKDEQGERKQLEDTPVLFPGSSPHG